jgi:hypothetical protein
MLNTLLVVSSAANVNQMPMLAMAIAGQISVFIYVLPFQPEFLSKIITFLYYLM